ncbi:hypothetical protein K438DRAFT_1767601 [Mycena galopus ATCC 62051]|nr:hypothetical protein K438DRAFT_1767601 [Mycena galopus ATCC 62051]
MVYMDFVNALSKHLFNCVLVRGKGLISTRRIAKPILANLPEQVSTEAIPRVRYVRVMQQLKFILQQIYLHVPTLRSAHIYSRAKSVKVADGDQPKGVDKQFRVTRLEIPGKWRMEGGHRNTGAPTWWEEASDESRPGHDDRVQPDPWPYVGFSECHINNCVALSECVGYSQNGVAASDSF